MAIQVLEIRRVKVRGGYQVQGLSRTGRGTKFILKGVDILTKDKPVVDVQIEFEAAIASMMPVE